MGLQNSLHFTVAIVWERRHSVAYDPDHISSWRRCRGGQDIDPLGLSSGLGKSMSDKHEFYYRKRVQENDRDRLWYDEQRSGHG